MDQQATCYFCGDSLHEGVSKVRLEVYNPDDRRSKCLKVFYGHKTCWTEAEDFATVNDDALAAGM